MKVTSSVHLKTRLSRQLHQSCQTGCLTHQIVREFADSHPQIPEQHIILGFQELVETGHVKIDTG